MINDWPGGYQGEVAVANTSGTPLNGWTVRLTLASGQTISSLWNGTHTATAGDITYVKGQLTAGRTRTRSDVAALRP